MLELGILTNEEVIMKEALVFLVMAAITASVLWRFKSYFISRVLLILLLLFQSQAVYHWVTGYAWK